MLTPTIPLMYHDRSILRIHVWMEETGHLATSARSLSLVMKVLLGDGNEQVIFDTDASIRRFADVTKMSAYQRDVLTVAAKFPWEQRIVSIRALLQYGYGVTKLTSKATLASMYEACYGEGSSSGVTLHSMISQLDYHLLGEHVNQTPTTGLDQALSHMNQYIAGRRWLTTMLNSPNARWAHARNMRLTEALSELWSTMVAISPQGYRKAIDSGYGVLLHKNDDYTSWTVSNRPKRIPAEVDSILAIPATGVITMVTPSEPTITDDNIVTVRLATPRNTVRGSGNNLRNISEMVGTIPSIPNLPNTDYLLIGAPYLPLTFSAPYLPLTFRTSSTKKEVAGDLPIPAKIRIFQAARGEKPAAQS